MSPRNIDAKGARNQIANAVSDDYSDVESVHPAYELTLPKWQRVRDTKLGEDEVKSKGVTYLPKTPAQAADKGTKGENSYNLYRSRAEVPDWVGPTHEAMYGIATKKPPTIELPTRLEYLRDRATPDGLTLVELANYVVSELLATGRMTLLSDAAKEEEGGSEPFIAPYTAEALTNWRIQDRTRDTEASLVVLSETVERPLNGSPFATEFLKSFRVFRIIEGGQVIAETYTQRATGIVDSAQGRAAAVAGGGAAKSRKSTRSIAAGYEKAEFPVRIGERAITRIPVSVGGVDGLGFDIGPVLMNRIATKTLHYYTISADYRQSLFLTAQPTPFIFGVKDDEIPEEAGASALWTSTDANVKAGYVEFSGSGITAQRQAMRDLVDDVIQIGMQMLSQQRSAESGDALEIRMASRTATLVNVVISAASIVRRAIQNCGMLMGMSDEELEEVKVVANLDFAGAGLPEGSQAVLTLWAKRILSSATAWRILQQGDLVPADKTYEDEQEAVRAEGTPEALLASLAPKPNPADPAGPKD